MRVSRPPRSGIGRRSRTVLAAACAALITVVLAGWASAGWRDLSTLPSSPGATPADALTDVAAILALAAWAWLLLGGILAVAEAASLRFGRWAPRIAPAAWRRLILAVVGVSLLSVPATAQARPGGGTHGAAVRPEPGSVSATPATPAEAIQGLPFPDRPHGRLRRGAASDRPEQADRRPATQVTVRPGDSLWAIAQRHLGPDAGVQAVATEWRRWYAVNRACIGPNPHLIYPGMVLHAPGERPAS